MKNSKVFLKAGLLTGGTRARRAFIFTHAPPYFLFTHHIHCTSVRLHPRGGYPQTPFASSSSSVRDSSSLQMQPGRPHCPFFLCIQSTLAAAHPQIMWRRSSELYRGRRNPPRIPRATQTSRSALAPYQQTATHTGNNTRQRRAPARARAAARWACRRNCEKTRTLRRRSSARWQTARRRNRTSNTAGTAARERRRPPHQ